MQSGKVKWFNYKNGYGFIVPENGEKDVFVHVTAVHASNLRRLEENQSVTFELNARRIICKSVGFKYIAPYERVYS